MISIQKISQPNEHKTWALLLSDDLLDCDFLHFGFFQVQYIQYCWKHYVQTGASIKGGGDNCLPRFLTNQKQNRWSSIFLLALQIFFHFHPLYTDLYVRVEMFLEFPKYAYLWFLYLEELSLLYLPGNYYNYVYI